MVGFHRHRVRLFRGPRVRKGEPMNRHLQLPSGRRTAALLVVAAIGATFAGASRAAPADAATVCPSATDDAYDMRLRALTGPAGADLRISVAATAGCARPQELKKIQLKTFAADGSLERTRNLFDVDAPGGVANAINLGDVPRDRQIEAEVLVQIGTSKRTQVLRGVTRTFSAPTSLSRRSSRRSSPGSGSRSWSAP